MTDLIYISTIMLVFTSVFKLLLKETARTWLFLRGCLLYNQYLPCQKIGLPMVFGCCLDENQKVGSPGHLGRARAASAETLAKTRAAKTFANELAGRSTSDP